MHRRSARWVTRHWAPISAVTALLLALLLGAVILLRQNLPLEFDSEWMAEILEVRAPWWEVPARVLHVVGGGWLARIVVPVAVIAALLLVRRRWAALYFGLAALLSSLLVQLLKAFFDRPRPEDFLVPSATAAFPSGHVANAATIAVTLGIIIASRWVWIAGGVYTLLMALSRTYLGAHWVSDTIGGALVGIGVAVIVFAPLASRLAAERSRERERRVGAPSG